MIKAEFLTGDLHDGNLDDLMIKGSSVLEREINHAQSIPSKERILIRNESSILNLKQKNDENFN